MLHAHQRLGVIHHVQELSNVLGPQKIVVHKHRPAWFRGHVGMWLLVFMSVHAHWTLMPTAASQNMFHHAHRAKLGSSTFLANPFARSRPAIHREGVSLFFVHKKGRRFKVLGLTDGSCYMLYMIGVWYQGRATTSYWLVYRSKKPKVVSHTLQDIPELTSVLKFDIRISNLGKVVIVTCKTEGV